LNLERAKKAEETIIDAAKILDQIIQQISTEKNISDFSHTTWEIFSKIEYSILMLKLYLGNENPGRLIKKDMINKNGQEMLVDVSNEIADALMSFRDEKYFNALESARRARNSLHALLIAIRNNRIKQV
tara:strand:- start:181 stop:567 length:387 start_codon:yes stop_codon:yes gene_type:complete